MARCLDVEFGVSLTPEQREAIEAKRSLSRGWRRMATGQPWRWFVTLTTGKHMTRSAFNELLCEWRRRLDLTALGPRAVHRGRSLAWMAAVAPQPRRRVQHAHLVLDDPHDRLSVRLLQGVWRDLLQERARRLSALAAPYDASRNGLGYIVAHGASALAFGGGWTTETTAAA